MNYIVYYYLFSDNHEAFILDYGFNHSSELNILCKEHGCIVYSSNTYFADVIVINGVKKDE